MTCVYLITRQRGFANGKEYFTIEDCESNLLADQFGNTLRFKTHKEALEFLEKGNYNEG